MERCKEAKGDQRGLEIKKPFFAPEKYSLQGANFRYCSKNFVPTPAFLLHNKNKNKNKNKRGIRMNILKKILIKN